MFPNAELWINRVEAEAWKAIEGDNAALPKAVLEAYKDNLNLFVQHTSCALSINENADSDVRTDMEQIFNRLVKENEPYYNLDKPIEMECAIYHRTITIPKI